jgi:hypothetical protein
MNHRRSGKSAVLPDIIAIALCVDSQTSGSTLNRTPISPPLPVVGLPQSSMPSFRQGRAESRHREVKGRLTTGMEGDTDAATHSEEALLGTGFRQSLAE